MICQWVSERIVLRRVNRLLLQQKRLVMKNERHRDIEARGRHFACSLVTGRVCETRIDLDKLARGLNLLLPWEQVAATGKVAVSGGKSGRKVPINQAESREMQNTTEDHLLLRAEVAGLLRVSSKTVGRIEARDDTFPRGVQISARRRLYGHQALMAWAKGKGATQAQAPHRHISQPTSAPQVASP